jgi:hypothetical protein
VSDSAAATQLASNPINEILRRLIEASESASHTESRDVLDETRRAALDRVFVFAHRLKDLIANASDADVSLNGISVISNALANALNEVNAFFSNKNPGHIDNAATLLDSATSTAAWAFFQVPARGARAYGETVASVQKAASEAIASLKKLHTSAAAELAKTQSLIEEQQQAIAGATEQIAANKQVNDAAVGELRTAFQALESEFRTRTDDAEKARANKFDTLVTKLEGSAAATLKKLSQHETAAKRIVQIVGNVGVTGNYQNRAQSERNQANYLRLGAVAFFVVGAIILAASVWASFDGEFNAMELLARAVVALTISAPAFYLAKESARHRSNADQAKQTELELASLTPFLEALPEEKRQEVIGSLSGAYFGTKIEKHDISHPAELSAEQVLKLVVQLMDGQKR